MLQCCLSPPVFGGATMCTPSKITSSIGESDSPSQLNAHTGLGEMRGPVQPLVLAVIFRKVILRIDGVAESFVAGSPGS